MIGRDANVTAGGDGPRSELKLGEAKCPKCGPVHPVPHPPAAGEAKSLAEVRKELFRQRNHLQVEYLKASSITKPMWAKMQEANAEMLKVTGRKGHATQVDGLLKTLTSIETRAKDLSGRVDGFKTKLEQKASALAVKAFGKEVVGMLSGPGEVAVTAFNVVGTVADGAAMAGELSVEGGALLTEASSLAEEFGAMARTLAALE
jgi:hypothetical protein